MAESSSTQRFTSRWGLILSVLGIAVGTGNIWRFPRIAATNAGDGGAGAFLVAWLVFLVAWSIPLIIAEYALGQRGRRGVVGTFSTLAGGKVAWLGAFVAFVAAAIMCYYSVVAGWTAFYLGKSTLAGLPVTQEASMAGWEAFQGSLWPVALHALMMGLGVWAVSGGVKGIERANKVLVPSLLVIVVIAVIRAVTLPGSGAGVAFLFTPDWGTLTAPEVWLDALTQNAWDTGAGWGLILTYAAYMRREDGVVRNAVLTGVGNNMVSLLAGTMIFGIVFAVLGAAGQSQTEILDLMKSSGDRGTGMTFIWMPQLFAEMPLGRPLAVLFFLALAFAAVSSLLSMIELSTRVIVDFGIDRKKAVIGVGVVGFLIGVPSALSGDMFGNQDFVWGVALMLSGAFIALAVIRYGASRLREDIATPEDWKLPRLWDAWITYAIPAQAIVLLGWWLYLAATAYSENALDPFEPYSAATCLLQWGVALIGLYLANGWMLRRLARTEPDPAPLANASSTDLPVTP
ncbi:sodium-dependent transporter [Rubricoccus marinus]|uniref:Sodium-dependent transporter n=1 Tax=Rubricoccus marinus TaxID=716817 RepID=A0A259TXU5_9BACT|nr:sodium-dependent transporter [Rubricoccus marinus]OZC02572.1 sodium-dependent transporter [Rubricoccus marinus]